MKPVRIIAVGSPYGDDRLAWAVTERLRSLPEFDRQLSGCVSVIDCDRPGAGLVEYLDGEGFRILIDAVVDGGPPGRLVRIDDLDDLVQLAQGGSHGFGLAATLQLAVTLGRLQAPWVVFGITIEPPGPTQAPDRSLSDAVAAAVEPLARIVALEAGVEVPRPTPIP